MPLELGIFLGSKRYGAEIHKKKRALILDREQFRYQRFVSDLAGSDITSHNNDARTAVERTREWLVTNTGRRSIPGATALLGSYDRFEVALPTIATNAGLTFPGLVYADFERLVRAWVKQEKQAGHL